ncbi:trypsin-7-like [Dermacentor albipictus]|uniref:trypsin-7-like n=1 Tax=Dermacentor albipictus TaxID=60249 RepID=UPI0038FC87D5
MFVGENMPSFEAVQHIPCFQLLKVAFGILVLLHGTAADKLDTRLNRDGCGESEPTGRIYRGKEISRKQVPWIAHILTYWHDENSHCGGSIITSNVLLTAAHCVIRPPVKPTKVMAICNSTKVFGKPDMSDWMSVESMVVHPKYSLQYGGWYDIALLKLRSRLKFDRFVKPICLPSREIDVADKRLLVAGWGRPTKYARISHILLFAQVVGMPDDECKSAIETTVIDQTTPILGGPPLCAMMLDGISCKGDSGGPMTLSKSNGKSVQVGLVSLVPGCPEEGTLARPEIQTRISGYWSWIRMALKQPKQWHKLHVDSYP